MNFTWSSFQLTDGLLCWCSCEYLEAESGIWNRFDYSQKNVRKASQRVWKNDWRIPSNVVDDNQAGECQSLESAELVSALLVTGAE